MQKDTYVKSTLTTCIQKIIVYKSSIVFKEYFLFQDFNEIYIPLFDFDFEINPQVTTFTYLVFNQLSKAVICSTMTKYTNEGMLKSMGSMAFFLILNSFCDKSTSEMRCIDKMFVWSVQWQMEFNAKECKIIHMRHNNSHFTYTLNSHTQVTEETNLAPTDLII